MTQDQIKAHIEMRQSEIRDLDNLWSSIQKLNSNNTLSPNTLKEIQGKISSRIAQCEISIRDHEKLLTNS